MASSSGLMAGMCDNYMELVENRAMNAVINEIDELLENILSMLPMYQLNLCVRVCSRWNSVVQRIKKSRHNITWFMYDSTEDGDIETQMGSHFKHITAEPTTAIIFAATTLHESKVAVPSKFGYSGSKRPRAAKQEKIKLTHYMQRLLPRTCKIIGSTTDGVVASSPCKKIVREMENSASASCLLLPQIEGVDVFSFTARTNLEEELGDFLPSTETPSPDPTRLAQVTGIPADKKAKLILLLDTEQRRHAIDADLGYALLKHYGNVVVAGGYVDHILPDDDLDNEEMPAVSNGIAFCGDNIKVASVLLRSHVRDKKSVESILRKLKATHVPERKSIGFMFACIGRGAYHYQETNVESTIFRKLFPNTPLFGFFGNGEIGYDYLPDYSSEEGDSSMSMEGSYPDDDASCVWDLPQIYHAYTTVFVLLSLDR